MDQCILSSTEEAIKAIINDSELVDATTGSNKH